LSTFELLIGLLFEELSIFLSFTTSVGAADIFVLLVAEPLESSPGSLKLISFLSSTITAVWEVDPDTEW